jgi:hypothetical protein
LDEYSCLVSWMGQLTIRGFHDGKDISVRFPGLDEYSCLVSRMGRIPANFPERDRYSCDVWTGQIFLWGLDGADILVRSGRGRYSCEFSMTVQILLRGVRDETFRLGFHTVTDINARFPEWDRFSCGFPRAGQTICDVHKIQAAVG